MKNEYVILKVQNLYSGIYEYEHFILGMYNTFEDSEGDINYLTFEDDYSRIHRIHRNQIIKATEEEIKKMENELNGK